MCVHQLSSLYKSLLCDEACRRHKNTIPTHWSVLVGHCKFFGVDEEDGDDDNAEDCFDKIKAFLKEILDFGEGEARDIELDRAHRMGRKRDTTIRPIVVKFHRYSDREKVRIRGYEKRDILKTKKLSVRAQWPKEIMDKRKPLYSVFKKEKDLGKDVKFVKDKLFVNGVEYKPTD